MKEYAYQIGCLVGGIFIGMFFWSFIVPERAFPIEAPECNMALIEEAQKDAYCRVKSNSAVADSFVVAPVEKECPVRYCPTCDCTPDFEAGKEEGLSQGIRQGEEFYQMYAPREDEKRSWTPPKIPRR